ncbi:site-specific integrase [Streptomyces sp. NBC_01017]|uniref:site-specific integrase n=1 Tax=Streptomyces sp. NBC_01017 TaxID=2903721 RepID=UPI00386ECA91|nr:site-specific integrase [Streptomyces sp. NBC_01017]WSV34776.1 site-specific integrase [Streptomyces sp. NBC_01017]
MYERDPSRVVVTGPLAPYAVGLCAAVLHQGYTPKSSCELMQLTAHLSRWMGARGVEPEALAGPVIAEFLAVRRRDYRKRTSSRALVPLLAHLRSVGAVPEALVPVDDSEVGVLLSEYRQYLRDERGVVEVSVRRYLPPVRAFLSTVPLPLAQGLAGLTAEHVTRFVLEGAACRSTADARPLAGAVPTVANRRLATLPGRLTADEVNTLLSGCDRSTPAGRRDFAVLTVLSRLGLRACEAAAIEINDVDWRSGELTIRGKGGLTDRLPLPADVGEALADYLMHGRPSDSSTSRLFLSGRAPRQSVTASGIRALVARGCKRTGLPRLGAHRLRHTVASDLLAAGAPLPEVGQVLRHRSQLSTAIYAKVDRVRLRELARPWPGEAS